MPAGCGDRDRPSRLKVVKPGVRSGHIYLLCALPYLTSLLQIGYGKSIHHLSVLRPSERSQPVGPQEVVGIENSHHLVIVFFGKMLSSPSASAAGALPTPSGSCSLRVNTRLDHSLCRAPLMDGVMLGRASGDWFTPPRQTLTFQGMPSRRSGSARRP